MAKILIIDDEQQLRGLLARIISLEGYDVTEAADCASGLKALRRCDPDGVQAIKNGAFDYITKDDDNNKILPLLSRTVEKGRLRNKYKTDL